MTNDELAMYDRLTCLDDEQWIDVKRELLAEVRRLRGLVQAVEWRVPLSGVEPECPWCGRDGYTVNIARDGTWTNHHHNQDCPAFGADVVGGGCGEPQKTDTKADVSRSS